MIRRLLVVLLVASPAFAALSPNVADWGNGPARWLMTKDEQRTWSKLQTDEEANAFIDLFWARRDPTRGTERNEFKDDFESRVRSADDAFKKGSVRGALTDPGRAYILFGPPARTPEVAAGGRNAMGQLQTTGRMVFEYSAADLRKLGLDRAPVFSQNNQGEYKIDPQQSNAFGAIQKAVDDTVINPDFTTTPEWALRGGVDAKVAPTPITRVSEVAVPMPIPVKQLAAGPKGASHLVLVKNLTDEIQPKSEGDPFAEAKPASTFASSEQLGYALQLCRDAAPETPVKVGLSISGTSGGKKVSIVSRPQDVTPEPIRAMETCSIVWASLPLASVHPGSYKLSIDVIDPATSQKWNLTRDFKVE
ncbi:MAG: GWxTD domain-containing protein [Acidobacteria bacterium]|nr:GWxTD domain-containing protein [Acidobacteriota bacterium]